MAGASEAAAPETAAVEDPRLSAAPVLHDVLAQQQAAALLHHILCHPGQFGALHPEGLLLQTLSESRSGRFSAQSLLHFLKSER